MIRLALLTRPIAFGLFSPADSPQQTGELKHPAIGVGIYCRPEGGCLPIPVRDMNHSRKTPETRPGHPNADGKMDAPGMKVLHSPVSHYGSTVPTLRRGTASDSSGVQSRNPTHLPI